MNEHDIYEAYKEYGEDNLWPWTYEWSPENQQIFDFARKRQYQWD